MEPKSEVKAEAKADAKPAPKQDEPTPPAALPGTDAARYITISHPAPAPTSPPPPGTTLSEMAAQNAGTGVHIDSIDRAIIDAFLRVWTPPPANKLPTDQRTAHVEVTVNREGKLVKYKPTRNSGNIELDMSVLEAANRLNKIDATLPADYPHEFYEFQVNFHVE
jgi:outer membrane biosynthesis protein TonB